MSTAQLPSPVRRPVASGGRTGLSTAAGVGLLLLAACVVLSILVGSTSVSWNALLDADDPGHAVAGARLARTFVAVTVGAALGVGGACLQGLTRNPLADPGILGVHAGASFAMIVAITYLGLSDLSAYLWFAFIGAALTLLLVQAVASLGRDGATPVKVVITGAAVTAALTSWISGVLLTDRGTMETFRFWQVGTVGGRGYDVLLPVLPLLVLGALIAVVAVRALDSLALGDDMASGLGRHPARDRLLVGAAVVLLCGGATALAGPVVFVGLVVPHVARTLVGPAHARLLPLSAVYGASLVTLADTVGRVVLPPTEVQVGIMTAVVGVPVFVALIRRSRLGSL
ncbi:FecCD family ABC transporter permease [Nocardioides caldifontis]|uniref:FecCD family ABC transporter permease n=1 Tax=Nocardioides caldifontis TaxID=2588938 RepID=UPI001EEF96A6|nr:iron ABC transporter permease [Nocardioides caldifontis]